VFQCISGSHTAEFNRFVETTCTEVTLCRKTFIVCGTAVTDELISVENAVITILGAEGSNWGLDFFFFVPIAAAETRFLSYKVLL